MTQARKATPEPVYWALLADEGGPLHIAATRKGLAYVGSPHQPLSVMEDWASRRFPGSPLEHNEDALAPYISELAAYLQGEQSSFTVPCDVRGTPFQLAVWQALRAIPYGQTRSYADIAEGIGKPAAVRAVGTAIGANPVLMAIPCHRVIGKNGSLTGYRGGLEMKKRLLELEQNGCFPK
ncbi:methylated-DNA--[protein]-cysteine S-methyltransferase [Paenibacillus sanguinis]|uniref:methylated-DNA--[protein]-cysteine S-methyltransferase n=1 Tax=Paenibacillus sanguinis TaxID=225906 RepID=UPI00037A79FC|nr:methylated-DNA--[protein]-cysteine S-methyltransferase [Paenibacillus sanguinis]